MEKLTRRTVYDDDDRGRGLKVPAHNGRGPWESEDPAQDMLESRLNSTQVRSRREGRSDEISLGVELSFGGTVIPH